MLIQRIEIDFAIPVELTDEEIQAINVFVHKIAKRNQPEGKIHWCYFVGGKPNSLATPVDPDKPMYDNSILYLATDCRYGSHRF